MTVIKSVIYPFPLINFRGLMNRFIMLRGGRWKTDSNQYSIYHEIVRDNEPESAQSIWCFDEIVDHNFTQKHAIILATEKVTGSTTIEFIDGVWSNMYDYTPIGNDFLVLIEEIISEWNDKTLEELPRESKREDEAKNAHPLKRGKIDALEYPDSVEHFRAWMDRYIALSGNSLSIMRLTEQRDYSISYEPSAQTSTREVWHMQSIALFINGKRVQEVRRGMVLATEIAPNKTIVDFIDGQYYKGENQTWFLRNMGSNPQQPMPSAEKPIMVAGNPIGEDFIQWAEDVKSKFAQENKKNSINSVSQEIRSKTPNTIEPIEYLGSVSNFRAWMDWFIATKGSIWSFDETSSECILEYDSRGQNTTRETWKVYATNTKDRVGGKPPTKAGMILAAEISSNKTRVEFLDGHSYSRPVYISLNEPVGDDFVFLANAIKDELQNPTKENDIPSLELWEQIPNVGWYRQALKLWHEGLSTHEIGLRVKKDEQTVRNKIAELRGLYGEDIVPRRRK